MKMLQRLWRSNLLIKWRSWEYWPFEVIYFPIFGYWVWLSLKARSPFFFTASNPGIEYGGMQGESKYDILKKIPQELVPTTLRFSSSSTVGDVEKQMEQNGLSFPVICKPDIGERGWKVQKVSDTGQLESYIKNINISFLVQEYIDLPVEAGVFYYRMPGACGTVSSVVLKEMLSVTGDGSSTLKQLILNNDRAKLQWKVLREKFAGKLDRIPGPGEQIELVSIGNHCKGTKFLNGNHLINGQLTATFDSISRKIDGFYFGRYDLRTASYEDLVAGRVKIMELNGAGAEPSHIYHPGASLREAYRVLFHHWKMLYRISAANHTLGTAYPSLKTGLSEYRKIRSAKK